MRCVVKVSKLANQYNTKGLNLYIPYTHHRDKRSLSLYLLLIARVTRSGIDS